MRPLTLLALSLTAAALSACISPSAVTGGLSAGAVSGPDQVAVLKEANRHIELCHRTYAWPFAVMIDCPAAAPVTQGISAADIEAIVRKVVAEIAPAKATTSP